MSICVLVFACGFEKKKGAPTCAGAPLDQGIALTVEKLQRDGLLSKRRKIDNPALVLAVVSTGIELFCHSAPIRQRVAMQLREGIGSTGCNPVGESRGRAATPSKRAKIVEGASSGAQPPIWRRACA